MANNNNDGFFKGMLFGAIGTHLLTNTEAGKGLSDFIWALNRFIFIAVTISFIGAIIVGGCYWVFLQIYHLVF